MSFYTGTSSLRFPLSCCQRFADAARAAWEALPLGKPAAAVRWEPRLLQGGAEEPGRSGPGPAARPARGSCSLHGHGRGSPGARAGWPAGAGPGRAEPGAARPGGLSQTKNSPGNQIRKSELEDFRIGAEGEMPGKPGKQSVCRELLSVVTSRVVSAGDRGWRTCPYPSVIFRQLS